MRLRLLKRKTVKGFRAGVMAPEAPTKAPVREPARTPVIPRPAPSIPERPVRLPDTQPVPAKPIIIPGPERKPQSRLMRLRKQQQARKAA